MFPPATAAPAQVPAGANELLKTGTGWGCRRRRVRKAASIPTCSVPCHAERGGRAQGSAGDGDPGQSGDQTRINNKLQGWREEFPARLRRTRQGSLEEGREWDPSWRQLPPICQIAWRAQLPLDMLDGQGPLPSQGASTKAGTTPRPLSLPSPGAKPRDLGREKGHFENTTHKCFSYTLLT